MILKIESRMVVGVHLTGVRQGGGARYFIRFFSILPLRFKELKISNKSSIDACNLNIYVYYLIYTIGYFLIQLSSIHVIINLCFGISNISHTFYTILPYYVILEGYL